MNQLNKILIANRGEIAVRVIRTAKAMGYRTVAVYSDADAHALHVQAADQAVCIGNSPVGESYLVAERLINAAQVSGADAIHPGYGFLSENTEFARDCAQAGVTFIGPSPEAIELMGSKRLSKIAMIAADVPCIPGYQDSDQTEERLIKEAQRIGFPLMVKASAGGGGRGMRFVKQPSSLESDIRFARSEAKTAFGNDELILERAVIEPRHIEIQVFADNHGNVVYLGERDCSIQRRHQKVVEEAPSPFVDEKLRKRMGEAAVNAAKTCHYSGAGTVEFLVDAKGNFYFLEMNTRLQVEHPVTELITGQDLVAWQLKVAAGDPLPLRQEEIKLNGHAMEVRLYAEDPRNNFMPQTGDILRWKHPQSEAVRVDHGIREGQCVSPHYDPMLAKIITHGSHREEARRRIACAVEDTVLLGVNNNKRFLCNILRHQVFIDGQATTAFIEQQFSDDSSMLTTPPCIKTIGLAAILMYTRTGLKSAHNPELLSWRNSVPGPSHYRLRHEGEEFKVSLSIEKRIHGMRVLVTARDTTISLDVLKVKDTQCTVISNGVRDTIEYVFNKGKLFIDTAFGNASFENTTHAASTGNDTNGSDRVIATMDGAIIALQVNVGERVKKGQTIAILEAMKMEHPLKAEVPGVIASISAKKGDQVKIRQLLVSIIADEP